MTLDIRVVEEICGSHGLTIEGVELEADVLAIVPTSLEDLPDAEAFGHLARELQGLGYRYVTLRIAEGERE